MVIRQHMKYGAVVSFKASMHSSSFWHRGHSWSHDICVALQFVHCTISLLHCFILCSWVTSISFCIHLLCVHSPDIWSIVWSGIVGYTSLLHSVCVQHFFHMWCNHSLPWGIQWWLLLIEWLHWGSWSSFSVTMHFWLWLFRSLCIQFVLWFLPVFAFQNHWFWNANILFWYPMCDKAKHLLEYGHSMEFLSVEFTDPFDLFFSRTLQGDFVVRSFFDAAYFDGP